MDSNKTSMGLEQNIAAGLSYVLGFITGIVFFAVEKENKFVRFHAMQSIVTFLPLFVISLFIGFIPIVRMFGILIMLLGLVLWIILMIKAFQGEMFKLPVVGDIAENFLNKSACPSQQGQDTCARPSSGNSSSKFCRNCGNPYKSGDRFCEKCGKQL